MLTKTELRKTKLSVRVLGVMTCRLTMTEYLTMSPKNKRWNILIDLLKERPHQRGAEIGVFEGDTSCRLMEALPKIEKLFCVDPFEHYPEQTKTLNPNKPKFHDADYNKVMRTFLGRMEPYKNRYILLREYSETAARLIENQSLDFVFIDGNHAYEFIVQDIQTWLPKVKPGGLLSGHDYHVKGHNRSFGVTRAVEERFKDDFDFRRFVWWHNVK
jgi:predicted O-methyltransferase YrrM